MNGLLVSISVRTAKVERKAVGRIKQEKERKSRLKENELKRYRRARQIRTWKAARLRAKARLQ